MQDIMPQLAAGAQLVQSYGPQGFRIGNVDHTTPVLITPKVTYPWNGELTIEAFAPFLTSDPRLEVLLVGTGLRHVMLPASLRAELKNRAIAVDSMDSGAACRTFNILLSEGRRVGAALQLAA